MQHLKLVETQDRKREHRLQVLSLQFKAAKTREERSKIWAETQRLIKQRSPEFVRRMERQKGLR